MHEIESARAQRGGVSRRAVLATAWSAPVVALAIAAPAAAASGPKGTMVIVAVADSNDDGLFTEFMLTANDADGNPVANLDVSTGAFISGGWQWFDNGPQTNLNGQWTYGYPLSIDWTRFQMSGVIDGVEIVSNIIDRRQIAITIAPSPSVAGYDLISATATSSPGIPAVGVAITVHWFSGGQWSSFTREGQTLADGTWSGLEPEGGSWTLLYISGTIDGVLIESNRVEPTS